MALTAYFENLIQKVEASEVIHNGGKDEGGFYKPTRTIVLRHLRLLRDLHSKPQAKAMVKASWERVVEHLPSEWLALNDQDKAELRRILES